MVRLKDIAAQAGVSIMTVSKALRGEADIAESTKSRVKLIAQQMGYVPDVVAQNLRSRKTKQFGLVISSTTNPVFGRLMMAIEEKAYELGYDLILAQSRNQPEREEVHIRRLLSRRVDGLFISPVYRMESTSAVYEELRTLRTPVVILGHQASFCRSFANVETDDIRGSYNATKHLLDLGHRRIAYLMGPTISPFAQERLEGYRYALREAKIDVDDKLIFQAGTTIEEGEKAALQLLQENPGATAIHAFNDLVAIGAANVLLNQGVRIPQDVSITGFGNVLAAEYFRVPLTTVRQPKARLGTAAMELMLKLLKGKKTGI